MRLPEHNSLQFQLAWRLTAIFIVVTGLLVVVLYMEARETARLLGAWNLEQAAERLLERLERDARGRWRLELPPDLKQAEESQSLTVGLAIHTPQGKRILLQAPTDHVAILDQLPQLDGNDERLFTTIDPQSGQSHYGIRMLREWKGREWIVTVVAPETGEGFVHAVLEEFLFDMAWLIPLMACAVLAIGAISLQRGLKPLRRVSAQAQSIEPQKLDTRLETAGLPAEVRPLLQAFNQALDRLQAGMEQQRRFTANAAHQLRTPLSILTAELELLEEDENIMILRRDVARMNRLVEQLLQVARLDSLEMDVSQTVDLHAVAVRAIADLVPLAQRKRCELSLDGESVMVHGNFEALVDALRNLIENALTHTPAYGTVIVEVTPPGTIRVRDQGRGILGEQKEKVFERFWRGHESRHDGAGLGLSIVREIMLMHGGEVILEKTGEAGTTFVLKFDDKNGGGGETRIHVQVQ